MRPGDERVDGAGPQVHADPGDPWRLDNVVDTLDHGTVVTGAEERDGWVRHDRGGWSIKQYEGHAYLRLDAWDGEPQAAFVEFWAAQLSLAEHLDAWCDATGRRRVTVVGVRGSDLANKCCIGRMFQRLGLRCCVVQRPGSPLADRGERSNIWVLPASRDISSTDVQRLLREATPEADAALADALHPRVARRLRDLARTPD